jgi:predicted MFS family arabinose efflux permease
MPIGTWTDPALALILFGSCFIVTRLLFAGSINRWGGFRVAMASLTLESAGLFVLWSARAHDVALAGAGLSGCGFALVFPALGVEALKMVADQDHGAALGVYTAFLDLAMGITGPIAGVIAGKFGYSAVFLYGSGAAICGLLLTLLLYRLLREPQSRRAGGIALKRDGKIVGAVGVSGGSGQQDHTAAEAGAQAF